MAILGPVMQGHEGTPLPQRHAIHATLQRGLDQGAFGGRALQSRQTAGRLNQYLAAQGDDFQQPRDFGLSLNGKVQTLRGPIVALPEFHGVAIRANRDDLHAVHGQGAGLVQAEHLHRAEALDRRQLPDEHLAATHFANAESQGRGRHGGQALGNRGHRQRNRGIQHLQPAHAPQNTDAEHQPADAGAEGGQLNTHVIQLALHGRIRRRHFAHQRLNRADLGGTAGGRHHCQTAAAGDDRAHVHHVDPLAQRGFNQTQGIAGFLHRQALAGEGRLIHRQILGGNEPAIGRDIGARRQHQHIAGHHLRQRDFQRFAATQHGGVARQQVAEGIDGFLGGAFGEIANQGVQQHDTADDDRVGHAARGDRHHGRNAQHRDRNAEELARDHLERRAAPGFFKHVGPVAFQSGQRHGLGQALLDALERGQGLCRRPCMPVRYGLQPGLNGDSRPQPGTLARRLGRFRLGPAEQRPLTSFGRLRRHGFLNANWAENRLQIPVKTGGSAIEGIKQHHDRPGQGVGLDRLDIADGEDGLFQLALEIILAI